MSAIRIGWDDIKAGYKMYRQFPYYALFDSNGRGKTGRLIFPYKGGDMAGEGWDLLEENLKAAEMHTPSTEFVIQFYDQLGKGDKLDSSTPYAGSFNIKMKPFERGVSTVSGISGGTDFLAYLQAELTRKDDQIRELQDQVAELEGELEEFEKQPKKDIGGIIGQIGEAGNQFPWMAELFKDAFVMLKRNFSPQQGTQRMAGAGISGVPSDAPPDQLVNDAIRRMVDWYIREYGQGATDEEKKQSGFRQFAADMQCLANLTADSDTMQLALKKLRAF